MTGVSKTPLLIFVVFAQFLALTAKFWQVNDHQQRQELTMNQSKTTLLRSRSLKGLVFLSPKLRCRGPWAMSSGNPDQKVYVCVVFFSSLRTLSAEDSLIHLVRRRLANYYEARNDYTNNSETFLLCNRCACNWKINSQTIHVCNWRVHRKCLTKAPNYIK